MGVWSDATDGYDPNFENLVPFNELGYVGVYHAYDPPDWEGETGYYYQDYRAPVDDDKGVVWRPLTVWATPDYAENTMFMALQADTLFSPPDDREYFLELVFVPEGISGAPPVGTKWKVPAEGPFNVELPTYRSATGEGAYRFAFSMSPVIPEPGGAALLAIGLSGVLALKSSRWKCCRKARRR